MLRVKDLRDSQKLTRPQFSKKARTSVSNLYKVERGDSSPTVETLHHWLMACNTNLARFFEPLLTTEDRGILNDEKRLHVLFERAMLVPSKKAVVKAVLESLFVDDERPTDVI